MKLSLTFFEAENLIRKSLGLPDETVITFVEDPRAGLPIHVQRMLLDINRMAWADKELIQSIKRFREVVPCSIPEGKWAIENWERTVLWIEANKRIPKFQGHYGSGTLRMV